MTEGGKVPELGHADRWRGSGGGALRWGGGEGIQDELRKRRKEDEKMMRDEWTRVEAEEHEATATIARCGCGCGTRYRQASPIAPHTHLLARLVSQVGRRRRCPRWAQQVALAVEEVSKPLATLDRGLGRALSRCEQYPLSRAYFAVPALSQRQLDRVFLLSVQCPQKCHCTDICNPTTYALPL